MKSSLAATLLVSTCLMTPLSAQTFDQFLVFGPSLLDSGYFKN